MNALTLVMTIFLAFAVTRDSEVDNNTRPNPQKPSCKPYHVGEFWYNPAGTRLKIRIVRDHKFHTEYRTPKYYIKSKVISARGCVIKKKAVEIMDPWFDDERETKFRENVRLEIRPIDEKTHYEDDYRDGRFDNSVLMHRIDSGNGTSAP